MVDIGSLRMCNTGVVAYRVVNQHYTHSDALDCAIQQDQNPV